MAGNEHRQGAQERRGRAALPRRPVAGPDPLAADAGQHDAPLLQLTRPISDREMTEQVLDQMVDNIIIEKEAEKLGVSVSDAEVDEAIQSAFGFYPNGTPTPQPTSVINPTSTLNPLQLTLTAPTATPVITATATSVPTSAATATPAQPLEATPVVTSTGVVSPTATAGPTLVPTVVPTATPYTEEGFKQLYRERLDEFKTNYNVSESTIRSMFFYDLLRTKVQDAALADLEPTRPEVWARHILVADDARQEFLDKSIRLGDGLVHLPVGGDQLSAGWNYPLAIHRL